MKLDHHFFRFLLLAGWMAARGAVLAAPTNPVALDSQLRSIAEQIERAGRQLSLALDLLDEILDTPEEPVGSEGRNFQPAVRLVEATDVRLATAARRFARTVEAVLGEPADPIGPDGRPIDFVARLTVVRVASLDIVSTCQTEVPPLPDGVPVALTQALVAVEGTAQDQADAAGDAIEVLLDGEDCSNCSAITSQEVCDACEDCFWNLEVEVEPCLESIH